MNSRQKTAMVILGALVATPALANQADADYDSYRGPQYEYAQVISAEPLVTQVRVSVPRRECYSETHYVPVDNGRYGDGANPGYRPGDTAGRMILGGLIGAAIGHQIGNQQSRRTGAIAGAIIGSAIGSESARRASYGTGYGGDNRGEELRAVEGERCVVRSEEHVEEHVDGYRVTYRYNNHTYTTRTARDPGSQIRVRVSVDPLD